MKIEKIIPNRKKAMYLAKRQLPELVTDAINIEGIEITLPEVQTLLDGITVGGHKLSDVAITLNQINAWRFLFLAIEQDKLELSKKFSNELHSISAKEEAFTWGVFRDGSVTIPGTNYLPPTHDKLDANWTQLIELIDRQNNIVEKAMVLFLQMARNQFYFDVNKRTGRFMMNGILLSAGYPPINVPANQKFEFNRLMLDFYNSNNMKPMMQFLVSCIPDLVVDFMADSSIKPM